MKNQYKPNGNCSIDGCNRKATRGKKTGILLCGKHRADGSLLPSCKQDYKRTYHWKYAGIDINLDEYYQNLNQQNNCCIICKRDFSEFKNRPSVDHNHQNGQVRSLVCSRCNMLIEVVENKNLISVIQEYLDFWKNL